MLRLLLVAVLIILIVILAVQNVTPAEVRFLQFAYEMPLAFVITGAAVVGALPVLLLAVVRQVSLGRQLRQQQARADGLQAQIKEMEEREKELRAQLHRLEERLAAQPPQTPAEQAGQTAQQAQATQQSAEAPGAAPGPGAGQAPEASQEGDGEPGPA